MSIVNPRMTLFELRTLTADLNEGKIAPEAAARKLQAHRDSAHRDPGGMKAPGLRVHCRNSKHQNCRAKGCVCPCHGKG